MKYILIAVLILIPLVYLNYSYAYFYNFQGSHFIGNPSYPSPEMFNKHPGKETKKLVVLGDSLMAGTGSSSKEYSPAHLIAGNLASEETVELINLASPGVGVLDVYQRQLPLALKENPDYVVLLIGINDMHNKKSDFIFKTYYGLIVQDLRTLTNTKITLLNIPYLGSDKILYFPWNIVMDLQLKRFNEIISSIGDDSGLPVIDLYSQFKNQFKKSSSFYSYDEFHPSDAGYKLWGDYINANINR